MTTLVPSFLNGSSLILQVTRPTLKARMTLNFGKIASLTLELAALERCCDHSRIVSEYDQEIAKLQTADNLWHCEEEPLNHHGTPGRQIKQNNKLSLPHQNDCNTRTVTKKRAAKHRTITDSHNGSNNKQKVNNNRTTALERTAA